MDMKIAALLFLIASLAACSAADDRGALISDGTVRIEPSTVPEYDYRFSIINGFGMTYDFEIRQDREQAVADYLINKCKLTKVINESSITTGKWLTGTPRRLYTLDVKCL